MNKNKAKKENLSTKAISLKRIGKYRTEISMFIVLIVFFIIISFLSEYFFTSKNLANVLTQVSTNAVLSIGMSLVIITGGIDLSVGSILGLSGMLAGMIMESSGNVFLAIIVALAIGLVVGLINGYLVGYMYLPAFITTLGTQQICRSLDYVISDGDSSSKFPESFEWLGRGAFLGIKSIKNYQIIIIILYVVFIFILMKTKFGRYLYAIGSNAEATKVSGVNVKFNTMMVYVLSGLLSAVAALIYISRMMAVDATYGNGTEMDAIAAVVIGGISMSGGKGTLYGTIIGIFLVGFLRNALNLLGINPFWQGSAIGAVIILAVLAEKVTSSRKRV